MSRFHGPKPLTDSVFANIELSQCKFEILLNLPVFIFVSGMFPAWPPRLLALRLLLALLVSAATLRACRISEIACRNGRCVQLDRYCDGVDDCGDNTDEPRFCTGKYNNLILQIFHFQHDKNYDPTYIIIVVIKLNFTLSMVLLHIIMLPFNNKTTSNKT